MFTEIVVKDAKDSGFVSNTFLAGTIKDPEERSTRGIARLGDGETLLIGGLIKQDVNVSQSRVPLLSDIPIIGKAFRWKNEIVRERELLVFITPHIIDPVQARDGSVPLRREQGFSSRGRSIQYVLDDLSDRGK